VTYECVAIKFPLSNFIWLCLCFVLNSPMLLVQEKYFAFCLIVLWEWISFTVFDIKAEYILPQKFKKILLPHLSLCITMQYTILPVKYRDLALKIFFFFSLKNVSWTLFLFIPSIMISSKFSWWFSGLFDIDANFVKDLWSDFLEHNLTLWMFSYSLAKAFYLVNY
jgi:hypothetical protein